MELHEKTLELNITHELLNLADCWYWFLTDIPLWRYWRPRYRLPYLKFPKSTAAGFHITTEGKDDSTGEAGGGYDVRIRTGLGNHLLFVQYKRGYLESTSPDPKSEFAKKPHDHFNFEINGTKTNQHFVLRNLANDVGAKNGNAVVYGLPLISNMQELEDNAGKLIRKTKFISIEDIDAQAIANKVSFTKGHRHNFRVGKFDMSRCEVNFFFFFFYGIDRSPEIIADIVAVKFQKTLKYFISEIQNNYKQYNLYPRYIPYGLQQSFVQYTRYLLHYFEVAPQKLPNSYILIYAENFPDAEFEQYESSQHDVDILKNVFQALEDFHIYINKLVVQPEMIFDLEVPNYESKFLIPNNPERGFTIPMQDKETANILESLNCLVI